MTQRGRPLTEKGILNRLKQPVYEPKNPIATEMFIPNHSGDLSAGKVLRTPTNDSDVVNKKYVDDNAGGGASGNSIDVFFDSTNSDIATYDTIYAYPTITAETSEEFEVSEDDVLLKAFITNQTFPSIKMITSGTYTFKINAKDSSEPDYKRVKLYFKIYHRSSIGTETLLGTSDYTDTISYTQGQYTATLDIEEDTTFADTDRIVIKVYGKWIDGTEEFGGNVIFYYRSSNISGANLPSFSFSKVHSEMDNLNWSDSGHTMDDELDMGTHQITNLLTPTLASDGASKGYVDDKILNDCWVLADYSLVSGSPTTSVTFSDLDGDTYDYQVFCNFFNTCGSNTDYYIYLNGDTTATNYNREGMYSAGGSGGATNVNNSIIIGVVANNNYAFGNVIIAKDPSGYHTMISLFNRYSSSSMTGINTEGILHKSNTQITSLTLTSGTASGISANSRFVLYKKKRSPSI